MTKWAWHEDYWTKGSPVTDAFGDVVDIKLPPKPPPCEEPEQVKPQRPWWCTRFWTPLSRIWFR
jgi:hypothetical protein